MDKERTIFRIADTEFDVDVQTNRLREIDRPENELYLFDMHVLDAGGYGFDYDRTTKGFAEFNTPFEDREYIVVPPLKELDPPGMALKYGKSLTEIRSLTDFEIMVDQVSLKQRLNGRLTTLDIAGHLFYIDYPMKKLRPKDDFLSDGIAFDDVDYYTDENHLCLLPYDPKKHTFREPDYETITSYPKDLIAVQFTAPWIVDPVGFCREMGGDMKAYLMEYPPKAHHVAKTIPWQETGLKEQIEANRKRQQEKAAQHITRSRKR